MSQLPETGAEHRRTALYTCNDHALSHHLGNAENGMVQWRRARLAGAVSWAGMGDEKELADITATKPGRLRLSSRRG